MSVKQCTRFPCFVVIKYAPMGMYNHSYECSILSPKINDYYQTLNIGFARANGPAKFATRWNEISNWIKYNSKEYYLIPKVKMKKLTLLNIEAYFNADKFLVNSWMRKLLH